MNKEKLKLYDEPCGSLKNKTGSWRSFYPIVNKTKCIACGLCAEYCPEPCIEKKIKNPLGSSSGNESLRDDLINNKLNRNIYYYEADLDYCKGCGICAQVCPVKCIRMEMEK